MLEGRFSQGQGAGGSLKVGLKVALWAAGKSPEQAFLPPEPGNSVAAACHRAGPTLACTSASSPTQEDVCTLGFTYLSDQPIFLSEAFANSLGTISYSRLVKDL